MVPETTRHRPTGPSSRSAHQHLLRRGHGAMMGQDRGEDPADFRKEFGGIQGDQQGPLSTSGLPPD